MPSIGKTPAGFVTAFLLSIGFAVGITAIMIVFLNVFDRSGMVIGNPVLLVFTIILCFFVVTPIFWALSKRRMGYIWA